MDNTNLKFITLKGNFAMGRQYSTYLALREWLSDSTGTNLTRPKSEIKAMEEGLMGDRYTIERQYGERL